MRIATWTLAAAMIGGVAPAQAQVDWTNWREAGPGTVFGTIETIDGPVNVTYTGPYYAAILDGSGASFWNWPIYDVPNRPTAPGDMIRLNAAGSHSLTFSAPVQDLYFAIVSMGQPTYPVTYTFDRTFEILTEGQGSYGDGSFGQDDTLMALRGYEGHGVIRFNGSLSSLSWTSDPAEFWHGITIGVDGMAPPSTVPEPLTMTLLGTGLAGIAAARKRRRRSSPADSET